MSAAAALEGSIVIMWVYLKKSQAISMLKPTFLFFIKPQQYVEFLLKA